MGFNSMLFIPNDFAHLIVEDREKFANSVYYSVCGNRDAMRENGYSYFSMPWNCHADNHGLILVGGNRAENLVSWPSHVCAEINLLKNLAEKFGYRIVKKRK